MGSERTSVSTKARRAAIALGIAAPLALAGAAELALRAVDFRLSAWSLDSPLMVPDARPGWLRTDPVFTDPEPYGFAFAFAQSFEQAKPKGVARVALIGESSVRNLKEAGPLREALEKRLNRAVEVVNFGFACGSARQLQLAREALGTRPDALFVYTGHNEFVSFCSPEVTMIDERGAPARRSPTPPLRLAQLLTKLKLRLWPADRAALMGLGRLYKPADKEGVYATFRRNLELIARAARDAGVPVVFSAVASNYDSSLAVPTPGPELELEHGRMEQADGHFAEAKRWLDMAFAHEVRPIRADRRINEIIAEVGRGEAGASFLDFPAELAARTGEPLPGRALFDDHCHLNARGNEVLMDAAAEAIAQGLGAARSVSRSRLPVAPLKPAAR